MGVSFAPGGQVTAGQLPASVVSGSGHSFVTTVTSSQAAWIADAAAQAAALLASGTVYSWEAINPITGALNDFGSGIV